MQNIKIAILGAVATVSWIATWFLIQLVVSNNQTLGFLSWVGLTTVIAIAFTTFFNIVNSNRIYFGIFNSLLALGYLLIMPKDKYVILGGILFILAMILFEYRIRDEEKSRQDFSIQKISSHSVSVIIYGLLLLLGFNVFFNVQTNFNANPDPYYDKLAKVINKTAPLVTQQNKELSDIVAQEAIDKVKENIRGRENYVPFFFAIIITGLLYTFAFLIRWASVIVTWMIFQVLVAVRFFTLEKVMVEIKKLVI